MQDRILPIRLLVRLAACCESERPLQKLITLRGTACASVASTLWLPLTLPVNVRYSMPGSTLGKGSLLCDLVGLRCFLGHRSKWTCQ